MILAPSRWSLQRTARIANETLRELRVEKHPDKTFVGRTKRGFTFLGYWITEKGVTGVAPSAWEGFQERVVRLYEQNAPLEETSRRIGQYVQRGTRWLLSRMSAFQSEGRVGSVSPPQHDYQDSPAQQRQYIS